MPVSSARAQSWYHGEPFHPRAFLMAGDSPGDDEIDWEAAIAEADALEKAYLSSKAGDVEAPPDLSHPASLVTPSNSNMSSRLHSTARSSHPHPPNSTPVLPAGATNKSPDHPQLTGRRNDAGYIRQPQLARPAARDMGATASLAHASAPSPARDVEATGADCKVVKGETLPQVDGGNASLPAGGRTTASRCSPQTSQDLDWDDVMLLEEVDRISDLYFKNQKASPSKRPRVAGSQDGQQMGEEARAGGVDRAHVTSSDVQLRSCAQADRGTREHGEQGPSAASLAVTMAGTLRPCSESSALRSCSEGSVAAKDIRGYFLKDNIAAQGAVTSNGQFQRHPRSGGQSLQAFVDRRKGITNSLSLARGTGSLPAARSTESHPVAKGWHSGQAGGRAPARAPSRVEEEEEEDDTRQGQGQGKCPPHELDEAAASVWAYPSNRERRQYQFDIAQTALFTNTLVCLPTGLGKTLIAAVVMYNYYCWFPKGIIVFMAPTRPLVVQQITACRRIVPIPRADIVHMTGQQKREVRSELWRTKRVFFVTGQVLERDLAEWGVCPRESIVCVVVDEAHRATGNYAYCRAVQDLTAAGVRFRVLGLTATPGSKPEKVQEVIDQLQISAIEFRDDGDPDVKRYIHKREEKVIKVRMSAVMKEIEMLLRRELEKHVAVLVRHGVIKTAGSGAHVSSHQIRVAGQLLDGQNRNWNAFIAGNVSKALMVGAALAGVVERMVFHGMQSALHALQDCCVYGMLQKEESVQKAEAGMRSLVAKGKGESSPKLPLLEEIMLAHFKAHGEGQGRTGGSPRETRAIVFTTYRDSVEEIVGLLSRHSPGTLRISEFIGQSAGRDREGEGAGGGRGRGRGRRGAGAARGRGRGRGGGRGTGRAQGKRKAREEEEEDSEEEEEESALASSDEDDSQCSEGEEQDELQPQEPDCEQDTKDGEPTGAGVQPAGALSMPKKRLGGQSQKLQQAVLQAFHSGEFNVLVSTAIGEEGLDISGVDLVVCYDAVSVVRMTQRMGRTGRMRDGRAVVLAMEGLEYERYTKKKKSRQTLAKQLRSSHTHFVLHDSPRMLPHRLPKPQLKLLSMAPLEVEDDEEPPGAHPRASRKPSARGYRGAKQDPAQITPAEERLLARYPSLVSPSGNLGRGGEGEGEAPLPLSRHLGAQLREGNVGRVAHSWRTTAMFLPALRALRGLPSTDPPPLALLSGLPSAEERLLLLQGGQEQRGEHSREQRKGNGEGEEGVEGEALLPLRRAEEGRKPLARPRERGGMVGGSRVVRGRGRGETGILPLGGGEEEDGEEQARGKGDEGENAEGGGPGVEEAEEVEVEEEDDEEGEEAEEDEGWEAMRQGRDEGGSEPDECELLYVRHVSPRKDRTHSSPWRAHSAGVHRATQTPQEPIDLVYPGYVGRGKKGPTPQKLTGPGWGSPRGENGVGPGRSAGAASLKRSPVATSEGSRPPRVSLLSGVPVDEILEVPDSEGEDDDEFWD